MNTRRGVATIVQSPQYPTLASKSRHLCATRITLPPRLSSQSMKATSPSSRSRVCSCSPNLYSSQYSIVQYSTVQLPEPVQLLAPRVRGEVVGDGGLGVDVPPRPDELVETVFPPTIHSPNLQIKYLNKYKRYFAVNCDSGHLSPRHARLRNMKM